MRAADFFRARLANAYETELAHELDFILDTTMRIFDQIVQVPVLLSMLAVVLGSQDTESGHLRLPRDLYELYKMAVGAVMEKRAHGGHDAGAIRRCLRTIAYRNHLAKRRMFLDAHIREALQDEPALAEIWSTLVNGDEPPPLVKILTAPSAAGEGGEYQFSHISFQEFLYLEVRAKAHRRACAGVFHVLAHHSRQTFELADGLPPGFRWRDINDKSSLFKTNFYDNLTRIGGASLLSARGCVGAGF